jgi:hypothetical protein
LAINNEIYHSKVPEFDDISSYLLLLSAIHVAPLYFILALITSNSSLSGYSLAAGHHLVFWVIMGTDEATFVPIQSQ